MILEPTQQEYITSLESKIAGLHAELQQERQENRLLRQQLHLYEEIDRIKNSVLSSTDKAVARLTVSTLQGRTEHEYQKIEPWRMADQLGVSTPTVRKSLDRLAKNVGIIDKRTPTIYYDDDDPQSSTEIAPTPLLGKPHLWAVETPRNQGGNRPGAGRKPKCPTCQSEHVEVIVQTALRCLDCGCLRDVDTQSVQGGNQVDYRRIQQAIEGENQVDFSILEEEPPAIESTLTLVQIAEPENQLDNLPPTEDEPASDQLDSPLYIYEGDQLDSQSANNQVDYPSISPTADVADLLLDIAGTGNDHIIMLKGTGSKYTTIDRALHRGDMIAHLKGVKTVGSKICVRVSASAPMSTRAICDDADTPLDWQRLKEAAILLEQAGFKPILEESPVEEGAHVGGGHLWVIFDRLVDAYSARQTMLSIAPMLAESKEYWPNGSARVRLPGGRYIHGGTDAWCKLSDAYGTKLSHDGAGAADALLSMQSPSSLVRKYEKKTELVLMQQPARSKPEPQGGAYLDKDVSRYVIEEFNAAHSWGEIADMAGGFDRKGYFSACWRGDRTPNVYVHTDTDRACDYSSSAWLGTKCMDKYQVWCLIQSGQGWQEFRRKDLAQRCETYRLRIQQASA